LARVAIEDSADFVKETAVTALKQIGQPAIDVLTAKLTSLNPKARAEVTKLIERIKSAQ
jgi:HEAT repeat protein